MRALIGLFLLAAGVSGCESSECEAAKKSVEQSLKSVCDDPAYKGSPFCACCVESGYFSVDDNCTCRPLTFDTASCFYSTGDLALPQARKAVEYAEEICSVRRPALPWPPEEGDAAPAACRAPETAASSGGAEPSSSGAGSSTTAGAGGATGSGGSPAGSGGAGSGGSAGSGGDP